MAQRQTKDLLIRNIPIEVYSLLEKAAKEHHRSKTQEAIVAIIQGLAIQSYRLEQPKVLNWGKKPSSKTIHKAINEGRP